MSNKPRAVSPANIWKESTFNCCMSILYYIAHISSMYVIFLLICLLTFHGFRMWVPQEESLYLNLFQCCVTVTKESPSICFLNENKPTESAKNGMDGNHQHQ
jgi:hypothetical protein